MKTFKKVLSKPRFKMIIKEKIEGQKIYLKNLNESHATEEYCGWLSDKEVNENIVTKKSSVEELKEYIKNKNKDSECLFLGIFFKDNDKHIGNVKIDFNKKSCDFGILIGDKKYWGKGIGTEATQIMIDYAFYRLNLCEINLGVSSDNIFAVKIYEKIGFKIEKKEKIEVNEKFYNRYIMKNKKKRLVLGTVQLGLDYGVNNFNGKPLREKSVEILELAYKEGIRIFDTATAYGDAEEVLGEFISKNNLADKIFVISKLLPNVFKGDEDYEEIKTIIIAEIKKSLSRLGIKKLYGYLLHTPEYIYNEKIIGALKYCKESELIENYGVSIYEEKEALYAAELPVDFIQVPYSIFDQRIDKTDFFEICKKNRVVVFARSAFLQGLIVMEKDKIPKHLEESKEYLMELENILEGKNISKVEASILFSYIHPGIDYVVFGVDNKEQLEEDIKIIEKDIDFKDINEKLKKGFAGIKKSIIFPSLWKKQ